MVQDEIKRNDEMFFRWNFSDSPARNISVCTHQVDASKDELEKVGGTGAGD